MRLELVKTKEGYDLYDGNDLVTEFPVGMQENECNNVIQDLQYILVKDQPYDLKEITGGILLTAFGRDNINEVVGSTTVWFDDYKF